MGDYHITEKIFDCFFAGCIPIYWGANNITDYIQKECFIGKREYENYDQLYAYMSTMSNEDYIEYMDNISRFLVTGVNQFSAEFFSETIINTLLKDI